eukprot:2807095-Rhodomonas_salina.2
MPTKGRRNSLEMVAMSDEEPLSDTEELEAGAPRATKTPAVPFPCPEAPPGSPDTEYASVTRGSTQARESRQSSAWN